MVKKGAQSVIVAAGTAAGRAGCMQVGMTAVGRNFLSKSTWIIAAATCTIEVGLIYKDYY
jgi:hypothetical protein